MGIELRRLLAVPSPRFARAARVPTVAASAVATPPQLVSVATRLRGPSGVYACSAPSPARWLRWLPWQTPSALWGLGESGWPYRAVLFSRLRLARPRGFFVAPWAGTMPSPFLRSGSLAPAYNWPCSRRGAALVASSLQASTPSPRRASPLRFGVSPKPAIRRCTLITLRRPWSSPSAHRGPSGSALPALPPASTAWGPNFPKPVAPALRGERSRASPSAFLSATRGPLFGLLLPLRVAASFGRLRFRLGGRSPLLGAGPCCRPFGAAGPCGRLGV